MIEVSEDVCPTSLERRPKTPQFFQFIRDCSGQSVDESAHEFLALGRVSSIGGDRVLVELPTHQQGSMIVGSEDRVEAMFLSVGEQSDAGANRFADPVEVITRPAPAAMEFGLQSSPRLIELRAHEGNHMEGVHDRSGVGHHVVGGFLVSGEGIHSDLLDTVPEGIVLIFQPVGEGFG